MNRAESIARLADKSEEWDILIVGGGATGLGIAVDAASRGYRTALLEKADFAESTSSKSTKLIHGGVRYLRGGEVGLVRESLRERGRLLRNAPALVKPLSFVVPAYRWYEQFFYGSGLTLYDLLAGDLGIGSTGHLSDLETIGKVQNLRGKGLYGSTLYWDGQFDDARLAIAMARTAYEHGAAIVNHMGVERLLKEKGRVVGVAAKNQVGEDEFEIRAKVVINATGVFSDSIRKMDDPEAEERIAPSQGIHIVLDQSFLGGETAVMIPSTDDGRVLFAIPWKGRVLLGTTDTGPVPVELHPKPESEEVAYLLEHAGRYFEKAPGVRDIKAVFAGLRPLVKPASVAGGDTASISRSHSLTVGESNLVTIAGGKWTTYREMAEDTVTLAERVGDFESRACITADLPLLCEEPSEEKLETISPSLPYRWDDFDRAVEQEMAQTLDDVLSRRTRCTFLETKESKEIAPEVARRMAGLLGKSDEWVSEELTRFSELRSLETPYIPE